METDIKLLIKRQAKEACQLMKDDMYKQDVWLWDLGGFQLEFVSIIRIINHMTCYKSTALID